MLKRPFAISDGPAVIECQACMVKLPFSPAMMRNVHLTVAGLDLDAAAEAIMSRVSQCTLPCMWEFPLAQHRIQAGLQCLLNHAPAR